MPNTTRQIEKLRNLKGKRYIHGERGHNEIITYDTVPKGPY